MKDQDIIPLNPVIDWGRDLETGLNTEVRQLGSNIPHCQAENKANEDWMPACTLPSSPLPHLPVLASGTRKNKLTNKKM